MRVKMDVMKIVKKFQHLRSKHGPICLFLRTREATGHTNAMRTTHAGGERPGQRRCGVSNKDVAALLGTHAVCTTQPSRAPPLTLYFPSLSGSLAPFLLAAAAPVE
jgi:hypothetical protein